MIMIYGQDVLVEHGYEPDFISDFKELGFKNLEFAERSAEPWKVIEDIEFRTVTLVGNI